MASDKLNTNYIIELFASALRKQSIFEIVKQYLKFSYLQVETEKKLWQWLSKRYDLTGKVPTMGQIQQHFSDDEKVLELALEIKEVDISEEDDAGIIDTFERYIRKMKFLDSNDKITDLYNQGKKDQAWDAFVKYAEEFSRFSIHDAECETVFGDFNIRQARRRSEDWSKRYKIAVISYSAYMETVRILMIYHITFGAALCGNSRNIHVNLPRKHIQNTLIILP